MDTLGVGGGWVTGSIHQDLDRHWALIGGLDNSSPGVTAHRSASCATMCVCFVLRQILNWKSIKEEEQSLSS